MSDPESEEEIFKLSEMVKRSTAERAKKYIEGIFRHFGVTIDWETSHTLLDSFKVLINKFPAKHLFREYIERMKIRNYQYFGFLVKKRKPNKGRTGEDKEESSRGDKKNNE